MRQRALAGPAIARLAEDPARHFRDEEAWLRHLERLGLTELAVTPDPVRIATEGAVWGSIKAHGLLPDTVIVSDDAGPFALDRHALCCGCMPNAGCTGWIRLPPDSTPPSSSCAP